MLVCDGGSSVGNAISLDFAPNWSSHALSLAASTADGSVVESARPPERPLEPGRLSSSRPQSPLTPQHHRSRGHSVDIRRGLLPLPTSMAYDLRNVMRMTDIKTDNGFARAFIRLALERKLLHKHLKSLFSNQHLLQ